MLRLILNLIFVVVIHAETPHSENEGPCPVVPTPDNFNISKFEHERWYELYHSFKDELHFYENKKCIEKHVAYDPDSGSLVVNIYSICEISNKPLWSKHYAYVGATPGTFKCLFDNSTHPQVSFDTIESRIVDTDYKTYSVGYACGYCQKTNTHKISVSICSSTKHLSPPDKLQNTVKLFKMYNINIDLVPIDWSDCRARCASEAEDH